MEIGELVPIQCMDVLAGQTTYLNTSAVVRFQPMVSPAFERMNMHIVYCYVPYRILWPEWNDFISGQKRLELPTTKLKLQKFIGFNVFSYDYLYSLLGYFGLMTQKGSIDYESYFNFFPMLAYHKIWSDHFRNEQIQDEIDIEAMFEKFVKGMDTSTIIDQDSLNKFNADMDELYNTRRVNWGKDRFTKALLETEADPQISLPVGADGDFKLHYNEHGGGDSNIGYSSHGYFYSVSGVPDTTQAMQYASGLAGIDLSDFKLATAIWNFQINQNKFGRDIEAYFKKYGLRNMDLRLQRSEMIGGFAESIRVSDIIATSADDLGKQGGHALGLMKPRRFKHYAPEHGLIMTLAYIRPKATYYGGADRFYHKRDMLDFYQKEFSKIGYQPIFKTEIGSDVNGKGIPLSEDDMVTFGYEPRYEEYRSCASQVSGGLVPGENLSTWANPRSFKEAPNLNDEFIECNPDNQIWAFPNEPKAIVHFERKVSCRNFVEKSADPFINI